MKTVEELTRTRDFKRRAIESLHALVDRHTTDDVAVVCEDALRRVANEIHDVELELVRHERFKTGEAQAQAVAKDTARLERLRDDKQTLNALAYFLKAFTPSWDVLTGEALAAAEDDLDALEQALARRQAPAPA